ncbi:hypothetical protein T440DRAFT_162743 [Plenodomus tracheiphilus IPT5]|uniref:Uncharacterized protein n=1 Tax=Plenodomus tracheiphilus IPT5 TaxID=1408161 RepID=A0A6A7BMM8_9PLEO|nr:hypothetical protein T440DRAFT_162743 [Plenodomus tracheiphilus IPT5]
MAVRLVPNAESFNYFTNDLLRLPRELRDLIYTELCYGKSVYEMSDSIIEPTITSPRLRQELLETFFSVTTCSIHHANFLAVLNEIVQRVNGWTFPVPSNIWGAQAAYKPYIRRLEVNAMETELKETELLRLERECTIHRPEVRAEWAELLGCTSLQHLTIMWDKTSPTQFHWASFSPILYELRDRLPGLEIRFSVGYDTMLEEAWGDTVYDDGTTIHYYPKYELCYGVTVTNLVEPPSEEDRVYVERYCQRKLEVKGRHAIEGLLTEEPEQRRLLIPHYVVKEAALARVLMEEHYQVYKICRDMQANGGTLKW